MGQPHYRTAADGYKMREAPSWTEEKLLILEAYMPRFAAACSGAKGWWGLDGFAGSGLCWSLLQDKEIPASPLIICDAGPPDHAAAEGLVFCEQVDKFRAGLEHRTADEGDRVHVEPGDINERIHELLERIPRRAPTFAFLDPEGADLAWDTVVAIADHKRGQSRFKVEQLILFPTDTGFMRLLSHRNPDVDLVARVERMMPDEGFREVWIDRARGVLKAPEARARYLVLYEAGLRGLGYDTVLTRPIRRAEDQKTMYHLVFATDNTAGRKIMDHVFSYVGVHLAEHLGQGQLFDTPG